MSTSPADFISKLQNRRIINKNYPQETTNIDSESILDRVFYDILISYQNTFEEEYMNVFKHLKERMDDTNIITKYLSKLKPLRDEVAKELKN